MIMQEAKKQVVERFNREGALVWKQVHSVEIEDIIQWEVKRRKEFAREFIRGHFAGKPAAILEIGCGAGRNLEEILSEDPAWRGVGVDNASAMIEHCRQSYERNQQVSFELLDIDSGCLNNKFDVIILLGVVGYLESNANAFRNIQRMLRPGGYVIFTYGRGLSVARTLRAGFSSCKDALRPVYCRFAQRQSKSKAASNRSFFRCYTFSAVRRAFPSEWQVVSHTNLVFGSGILKQTSVKISRLLEGLFTRRDIFRLALTSLIVAVSEPNSEYEK